MPDNVDITPGTGKTIATDDVSGVQFQKMKVDVGGDGVSVPLINTEASIPMNSFMKEFTNTRNNVSANSTYIITVPTGANSMSFIFWPSAGSGITSCGNSFIELSYDGGTTYKSYFPIQWFILANGSAGYGNNFGGNSPTIRGMVDVSQATHVKLTWVPSIGVSDTLSEKYRFFWHPYHLIVTSGGLSVVSPYTGNQTNQTWFGMGGPKYSSEQALGSYDNDWGDRAILDIARRQVVTPYHLPGQTVRGNTAAMTGTASTQLLAAPGASVRNYLTSLTWSNTSAVDTEVDILDGSTVVWTFYAKALSGDTITFPVPLRQPTTNTALNVQNLTTGSSVKVSGNGFKSAA